MRKKIALVLVVISFALVGCQSSSGEVLSLNMSVAASLVEPMNEIIAAYESDHDVEIKLNSGGSGTLKKQISEGANVGLFFSASEKYMDQLIEENLVLAENKENPIHNTLVLIKNNDSMDEVQDISDLANVQTRIAIGEVSTVPAGEYAKEALLNMGLYSDLESNLIYAKDVTAVKTYVERGEVDYGIVYKSDALNLTNSSIVSEIPSSYHTEIVYSLAPIEGYEHESECKAFIDFINSDFSKQILSDYGFKIGE
ncbi:MAG: molybdate ABC transporter substrate-binding protein [Turicibacter sp.]